MASPTPAGAGGGGSSRGDPADMFLGAQGGRGAMRGLKGGMLEKEYWNLIGNDIQRMKQPILNAADGMVKLGAAFLGFRDIGKDDTWLLRIGGAFLKVSNAAADLAGDALGGIPSLTDKIGGLKDVLGQSDELSGWTKFMLNFQIIGLSILGILGGILGVFFAVIVVVGLLSLAIQGANSPIITFYESLSGYDKFFFILTGIAVLVGAMGGAFATIAAGFIGLIAVASGKFSAFWSVIIGIVSAIVIVFSLIALGVGATFAIPIAVVLLLLTLAWRFRSQFLKALNSIWDAAASLVDSIGERLSGMYQKYIAWWFEPLMKIMGHGSIFRGGGITAQSQARWNRSQTNNVTVNMNGGSVTDGYRIGRAAGVGIQDETRRQGGATTRGAI